MKPAPYTESEIKALLMLGAIIGGGIGLVIGSTGIGFEVMIVNVFPWKFIVTISSITGAIIGGFNRAPMNSCLGAFVLGAIVGAIIGTMAGLMVGAIYWYTLWRPITTFLGLSLSLVISGVIIGAATGAAVIEPNMWHDLWR
jgi:hypothetical protein